MSTVAIVVVVWAVLLVIASIFLKLIGDYNAKIDEDNEQLYYDMLARQNFDK